MNFKYEIYEIEFTEDCRDEIREIYRYISKKLIAKKSAKQLMQKIRKIIMNLAESPKLYPKINKYDKIKKRCFRKIVIDNYVILYTIDEQKKVIYISHMYYGGKNYLESFL